jgi:tripartite ATP-independent transporter DctP family solute receptor
MKISKLASTVALLAVCTAASAQIQERTLRFGNVVQADAPLAIGMQKFADIVAAKSGGKIKVQVIGGGSLGSESQQLSSVQGGVLDMTLPSATIVGTVVKDFTMLDFPFSFNKEEQVDALVDGPWGKAVMAKLPEKGVIGLGFWETGFRQFTNSRKPIVNIEDLKGLKLRVIPNPMFMESFAALGTNPVPMAFTELYGALDSKAMDAQENPFAVIFTTKFYEVQKYLSVTSHVYTSNPVVISKKTWDKLSAEEQKLIQDAVTEGGLFERKLSRETAKKFRQDLVGKGMQINDVPVSTLTKMKELTKPTIEKFSASYNPALVSLYQSEMARIRKAIP